MNLCKTLSLIFLSLLLYSCNRSYDEEICADLYVKAYRGHPRSAHEYETECVPKKLIPKFNCQQALEQLILGKDVIYLKAKYGPHVMKCFTEKDLKLFHRPEEK